MKTTSEIQQRIRGLLVQELDRRVNEAKKRLPVLCKHNYQHPLDSRKVVDGEPNKGYNRIQTGNRTIGLCLLGSEDPEQWGGTICEDPIDAQKCPLFDPIRDQSIILVEFQNQIGTPGWLQEHLPAVHELVWVVDGITPVLPWWKKIWYRWFLRIRVESVVPSRSLDLLLEGPPDASVGS